MNHEISFSRITSIFCNPLKDFESSCLYETSMTSVICTLKLEQKTEQEPIIVVTYNTNSQENFEGTTNNIIEHVVVGEDKVTRVCVDFFVITQGADVISACLNAFSICALLGNIKIYDTLSAVSAINDKMECCLMGMAYFCHSMKVINFYNCSPVADVLLYYDACRKECEAVSRTIKNYVIEYLNSQKK